jgi:hypothetical protein
VLLSPEGEELAKFRGYIPPERMREILTHPESLALPESAPETARNNGGDGECEIGTHPRVPAECRRHLERDAFLGQLHTRGDKRRPE